MKPCFFCEMTIIKATEQDIRAIRNIAEKSWNAHYPGIISEEQIAYMLSKMYSEEELKRHFNMENFQYYFIENHEGNRVGIMGFELHYEPLTTKLHRIYLLKESTGSGYGKGALDFLKQFASQSDDRRIILTVNKRNPAKFFYETQGFKVYDEAVFDIGNHYVMDDFLMEFLL